MNHLTEKIKQFLRVPQTKTQALTSWSHWTLIALFGLLCWVPFWGKGVIILVLFGMAALVNGPLMLLFGAIYAFLMSLFPPLAFLFSLLLLLNECFFFLRNWRFGLFASYFYLVPFTFTYVVGQQTKLSQLICLAISFVILQGLMRFLYRQNPNSHGLFWSTISVPYDTVLFLIPRRFFTSRRGKSWTLLKRKHFK